MSNPYVVQPVNIAPGLAGLSASVQRFGAQAQERKQQEQLKQATEEAIQAYESGDNDKIAEISIKYPKIGEMLSERVGFRNQQTKDNYLMSAYKIIEDPTPENVQEVVQRRQAFLRSQGVGEQDSAATDRFLARFLEDPASAVKGLEAEIAAIDAPRYQIFKKAQEQKSEKQFDKNVYFDRYQQLLKEGKTEEAAEFAKYVGIHEDPNAPKDGATDTSRFADNIVEVYQSQNPSATRPQLAKVRSDAMLQFRRAQAEEVTSTQFAKRNVDAATAERIAYNGQLGTELAKIETAYSLIKARGEDTPAEKQTKASQRLTGSLAELSGHYAKLDSLGSIVNVENNTFENVFAAAKSSAVGQQFGRVTGTEDQSVRQAIRNIQPLIVQYVRQATDMGARGMDSEKELEFYLRAATNEKVDLQSNIAAIVVLDEAYGTGEVAAQLRSKTTPTEIEKVRARGQKILEGGETVVGTSPTHGQITEADIQTTMRENNMTREQVLQRLGIK